MLCVRLPIAHVIQYEINDFEFRKEQVSIKCNKIPYFSDQITQLLYQKYLSQCLSKLDSTIGIHP